MGNYLTYSMIMLLAGFGIPLMAALNGGLGVKLGNASMAAVILLSIALSCTLVFTFATSGFSHQTKLSAIPWYFFLGGVFVMFYIVSISKVAPHFGVANAIAFVLLGQLIAMTVVDHFGLFGAIKQVLTAKRALGLLLMSVGVFLVLGKSP